MTTTKKMTKRDYFNILRASFPATAENYDEVIAFIDHELELLAKKNSADRKPSKAQVENDKIRAEILSCMIPDQKYTISDMIKTIPCCAEYQSQRMSGLLRPMYDKDFPENPNAPLMRIEEKRKAYFMLNPDYQG